VGLWPLACWDCGFESSCGHGCLSVVSVVLSGRGLCDGLITRPEESFRLWCVVVCDLEISRMKRPWLALGRSAIKSLHCIIIATNTDKGPHIVTTYVKHVFGKHSVYTL